MKSFATALIAIGATAIKLRDDGGEESGLGSWEARAERMHSVIDWNGDSVVDGDELGDLVFLAETFDYIDADEADVLYTDIDIAMDYMGGPFSFEDLQEEVEWMMENGDDDDWEVLYTVEDLLEGAEEMLLDAAIDVAFDELDLDDNDEINVEEVEDAIDDLDLDDEEAGEFYAAFEALDADEDMAVSWDEWETGVRAAMEEDPELKWEVLEEAADYVNEFDVDCSADGVDGCDDERAAFQDDIEEWAESTDGDE